MKWNFPRPLLALIVGLISMTGAVHAQDQDDSILEKLKLSSAQREQIKELNENFRKTTAPLRTEINRLLEVEKKQKSVQPPDMNALKDTMKKRADKEIELALELTRYREGLEALLTVEQRKLLQKLTEEKKR